ncbi:MAG: PIN domain-containing protein [Treponema sp.]|nr:PIN domain-containing protein [Treponema sp.]
MRVLLDTNVLLDYLLTREPYYEEASRTFSYCLFSVQGFIAAHSFVDLFYQICERDKKSVEYCRNTFLKLCRTFEVCAVDKVRVVAAAGNLAFNDFEDALQAECALNADVDYIITRNPKDFADSAVAVLSPAEFLRMMEA